MSEELELELLIDRVRLEKGYLLASNREGASLTGKGES